MDTNDLKKLEIQKIYDEIHQLRNHQFLITLAAITFFGAAAAWAFDPSIVFPKLGQAENSKSDIPLGSFCFALVIGLILVLNVLYFWVCALSKLIARFSTYLAINKLSDWEKYHAKYDSIPPRHISQRKAISWVFLVLGFLSVLIPISLSIDSPYALEPRNWFVALLFIDFFYIASVIWYGFLQPGRHNRDEAIARWKEVAKILGITWPNPNPDD
jgi:hypothetical protein